MTSAVAYPIVVRASGTGRGAFPLPPLPPSPSLSGQTSIRIMQNPARGAPGRRDTFPSVCHAIYIPQHMESSQAPAPIGADKALVFSNIYSTAFNTHQMVRDEAAPASELLGFLLSSILLQLYSMLRSILLVTYFFHICSILC